MRESTPRARRGAILLSGPPVEFGCIFQCMARRASREQCAELFRIAGNGALVQRWAGGGMMAGSWIAAEQRARPCAVRPCHVPG